MSRVDEIREALRERNLEYPLSNREARYLLAEHDRLAAEVEQMRGVVAALVEALRGFPHTMPSPMDIALQGRAPIRHWSIARRRLYDSISAIVAAHDTRLARGEDAG